MFGCVCPCLCAHITFVLNLSLTSSKQGHGTEMSPEVVMTGDTLRVMFDSLHPLQSLDAQIMQSTKVLSISGCEDDPVYSSGHSSECICHL